jgi:hypothetical protein
MSEAYQIDILNGSTVVRTLSVSSPTVAYSATQQAADFGAPQSSVSVRIYQMEPDIRARLSRLSYSLADLFCLGQAVQRPSLPLLGDGNEIAKVPHTHFSSLRKIYGTQPIHIWKSNLCNARFSAGDLARRSKERERRRRSIRLNH